MPHAKNTKNVTVEPILFDSYLAFIEGSVGSHMFRKFYASITVDENIKNKEVLDNGRLSCAVYASSILRLFDLCSSIQLTVHRLLDDMEASGWYEVDKPKKGAVVLWGENLDAVEEKDKQSKIQVPRNRHIGFYLNEKEAISHRKKTKAPAIHPLHYHPIEKFYWHNNLEK